MHSWPPQESLKMHSDAWLAVENIQPLPRSVGAQQLLACFGSHSGPTCWTEETLLDPFSRSRLTGGSYEKAEAEVKCWEDTIPSPISVTPPSCFKSSPSSQNPSPSWKKVIPAPDITRAIAAPFDFNWHS
ncbi:predicted protein [Coccidioides posadasii str. Silveira]|uniref:Predicted protein n=2 Tax=Coccidioides posadasii TaxID=199306 RepID=E9CWV5_COCPS|nr:predicted protein [Coccidioides posadasii str. Silveira]KMM65242.1 hypothetical protein CPAG_01593 [Coccidioides posadasii RMSCC 3488]